MAASRQRHPAECNWTFEGDFDGRLLHAVLGRPVHRAGIARRYTGEISLDWNVEKNPSIDLQIISKIWKSIKQRCKLYFLKYLKYPRPGGSKGDIIKNLEIWNRFSADRNTQIQVNTGQIASLIKSEICINWIVELIWTTICFHVCLHASNSRFTLQGIILCKTFHN